MIYPDGEATCAFLMGKGYIAHRKRTVPQLEMLAAVVAVKLDELLRKILTLTILRSHLWSDSTVMLLSIYSTKKKFPVFMANRLAEIEETMSKADWKYVLTNVNPTDDISKGLVTKSFVQRSKWLTGPEFLKQSPLYEPQAPESVQMVQRRLKSNQVRTINALPVVFSGTDKPLPIDKLITHYSSLHKLKTAALWLLRFGKFLLAKVRQCTNKINASLDRIAVNETDKIEKLMIRSIHLEVLHAMTADSFFMAFDRFRSRRGQVDHLYSDNGTNFVAAAKALDKQLALWICNVIDKSLLKSKVQWHFNSPYASHHGGSWERLICSVKSTKTSLY